MKFAMTKSWPKLDLLSIDSLPRATLCQYRMPPNPGYDIQPHTYIVPDGNLHRQEQYADDTQNESSEGQRMRGGMSLHAQKPRKVQRNAANSIKSAALTSSNLINSQKDISEFQKPQKVDFQSIGVVKNTAQKANKRDLTHKNLNLVMSSQTSAEASNKKINTNDEHDPLHSHTVMKQDHQHGKDVKKRKNNKDGGGEGVALPQRVRSSISAALERQQCDKTQCVDQGAAITPNRPVIDRLAFTVPVEDEDQQIRICRAVKDLMAPKFQQEAPEGIHLKAQLSFRGTRYHENHQVMINDDEVAELQVDPLQKSNAFIRVDFNPNKLTPHQLEKLIQVFHILLGDSYDRLMTGAKVTQIDIAIDIPHLPISDLILHSATMKTRKSLLWGYFFDKANLEKLFVKTYQVGSRSSPISFIGYDKRKDLLKKEEIEIGHDLTRIESRCRPQIKGSNGLVKHGVRVHQLSGIENPFKNLKVAVLPKVDRPDWLFRMLLIATRQVGVDTVVHQIDDAKLRRKFREYLAQCAAPWWNTENMIEQVVSSIKAFNIFPASAFKPPKSDY